jgi:SagB-type dehydrogenase family enzyme
MDSRQDANWHLERARRYHQGTKHPSGRLFDPRHMYDPRREPRGHKIYPQASEIPLAPVPPQTGAPAIQAVTEKKRPVRESPPTSNDISRILYYTGGITKRLRFSGLSQPFPFRAAACTGALYHIELYLVCRDISGISAGVYHYAPESHTLSCLQQGDHRRRLWRASGEEDSLRRAPAVLVFTDAYWRNAFKYQAREFRHAFWDSGTMAANTLAMCAGLGLEARVILGFADPEVGDLLGLSDQPEFPVLLVAIGKDDRAVPPPPDLEAFPDAEQGSEGYRTSYPAIEEIQVASSLTGGEAAMSWRKAALQLPISPPEGEWVPLVEINAGDSATHESIEAVILRRGSARRFLRSSISGEVISSCLAAASAPLASDSLGPPLSLNHLYLIASGVEGIPRGAYVFHPQQGGLERLAMGDFRQQAGHLALGQRLAADASTALFFLTDLEPVLRSYGNRGYRAAQIQASIAAGRIYLAAYAQPIGATGLTFYDDAVTEFFAPHAEGKSVMFLIAIGNPA